MPPTNPSEPLKYVVYVPGHTETVADGKHELLFEHFRRLGLTPVYVEIDWSNTTISEWVARTVQVCEACAPRAYGIAGFSFGAMAALIAAAQLTQRHHYPAFVALLSLSGFFAEDLPARLASGAFSDFPRGSELYDGFSRYRFDDVSLPGYVFLALVRGADEVDSIVSSVERAESALWPHAVEIVPGARHAVYDPAIASTVARLSDRFVQIFRSPWTHSSAAFGFEYLEWRMLGLHVVEIRRHDQPRNIMAMPAVDWRKFIERIKAGGLGGESNIWISADD